MTRHLTSYVSKLTSEELNQRRKKMSKDPINFLFQEQTYKVVANPTNEDFDMQYAGVSFTIKSGEEKTRAINAANHILNS